MPITTCTSCEKAYDAWSEESANEPGRLCPGCDVREAKDAALGLHDMVKDLKEEVFRYCRMIAYAHDAPDFASCKSILMDTLDGVRGAENYDNIRGEREILKSRISALRGALQIYFHAHESGNSVPPNLVEQARAALKSAGAPKEG